jgi:uncharacterized Zn-binding protein involved in type VI secretion
MPGPIAVTGDLTTPEYGPPNVVASVTPTVLAEGRPVVTIGAIVAPHGNYYNPKAPGFNPTCAHAIVATGNFSSTVLIEGKPAAIAAGAIGTRCSCMYHSIAAPGAPTVLVGA